MPSKEHRSDGTRKVTSRERQQSFHLEFKNPTQRLAWQTFQSSEILFFLGAAGTGKSFLSMAFAINEVLAGRKSKIILTRPIVEAGESLGYLPGTFDEKVAPYMTPLYDCLDKLLPCRGPEKNEKRSLIESSIEVAPLAFLRGRTFDDAVAILDEAQNASGTQLKLFMTRIGENSKLIINGDPCQSDLPPGISKVREYSERLSGVDGIGAISFSGEVNIRNPIIDRVLSVLN